jgi:hypothetical protein
MSPLRKLGTGLVGLVLLAAVLSPPAHAAPTAAGRASATQGDDRLRAVPGLPAGSGSVLGYQCGAGVCLIDPDVKGAQPVVVVPDGAFAGVTADGSKLAYYDATGVLVTAPTTGGAPTVVFDKYQAFLPVISPDGTSFLWQYPVQVAGFYYTFRLDVATGESYGVAACACVVSHGWAGTTPIAVFPSGGTSPSRICTIERGGGSSCKAVLASETRGQLAFPDGTADGQTFVASVDVDGSDFGGTDGPLALYSRATGTVVKDLTTGATDATPTLSQQGDRVAFERDGTIVIVDVATGVERVVGPGVYPSWGGTPRTPGVAEVAAKRLRYKSGRIKLPVACSGSEECRGKATLAKAKKTYAKARYSVAADGSRTVGLKPTKLGKRRLRGDGKVTVIVTLEPADGASVRAKVTLRY